MEGRLEEAAVQQGEMEVLIDLRAGRPMRFGAVTREWRTEAVFGACSDVGHVPRQVALAEDRAHRRDVPLREADHAPEGLVGQDFAEGDTGGGER